MIFETLEVDNIKSTIKRASKWRHNSYDWVEEWDWIDSHLIIADKKIKEQQEEINRLTIAYQNASDQRQHYVDKCLKLSEVILEFASTFKGFTGMDGYERANLIFSKHKDLIDELKRNLEGEK